jgi:leukotriene-A4 hydrolase
MAKKRDPNTFSNYHEVRTTHISINFDIFFKEKRLVGNVIQKMKCLVDKCESIILDSR